MTLTMTGAPLSTSPPAEVNYSIEGPTHKLLLTPFPRRVRATIDGATVFDTDDGGLLHESNLLPVLYVPLDDVDTDRLTRTEHSTHCPFKGDASYWSIRREHGRVVENAAWSYEEPMEAADWLRGTVAFYWDKLDQWFDEDEEVFGHLRDPYHRVDVRASNRQVTVRIGNQLIAESSTPMVLSETGLPNRWYLSADDVRREVLRTSATSTHCPYKGQSTYWSYTGGDRAIDDIAWSYDKPFDDARRVEGHFSFDGDHVIVEVGAPAETNTSGESS